MQINGLSVCLIIMLGSGGSGFLCFAHLQCWSVTGEQWAKPVFNLLITLHISSHTLGFSAGWFGLIVGSRLSGPFSGFSQRDRFAVLSRFFFFMPVFCRVSCLTPYRAWLLPPSQGIFCLTLLFGVLLELLVLGFWELMFCCIRSVSRLQRTKCFSSYCKTCKSVSNKVMKLINHKHSLSVWHQRSITCI